MTAAEAKSWSARVVKQRYEWLEIVGKALGFDVGSGAPAAKKCANPMICDMCRKPCASRATLH